MTGQRTRGTVTILTVCFLVLAGCAGSNIIPGAGGPTPHAPKTQSPASPSTTTVAPPPPPIEGATVRVGRVVRVIDGDTVAIKFQNGTTETVHLIGVDTPETAAQRLTPTEYGIPNTSVGRERLLYWGNRATEFTREMIGGEQVRVVLDPKADTRGSDGRLFAYIYYTTRANFNRDNGMNVNRELLSFGYARRADNASFSRRTAFGEVEARVQAIDRGVWGFAYNDHPHSDATPPATPIAAQNCSDFESQADAQLFFERHYDDSHRLDSDEDGQACESLL